VPFVIVRRTYWLVAAITLFVATRLIALPEPLGVDQGIFATAGWGLGRGLMLYRDVWDQKPPGIHLLYAAGFAIFGPHPPAVLLLDTAACAAACTLVFLVGARLHSRLCGWLSATAFAIGTYPAFARAYGGFLERAVAETFIAPLVVGAALSAISSSYAMMGLLIGVAAVLKPTALVYWPACLAVVAWRRRDDLVRAARVSGAMLLLPWIAVGIWLWFRGALPDAWVAIVDYNRAYVAAGAGGLALPDRLAHEVWRLVKTDPLWCVAAAAGLAAVWRVARNRDSHSLRARVVDRNCECPLFAMVWLTAVVCAIAANGVRMYATYFLPAGPPLALLAGWFLAEHRRGRRAVFAAAMLTLAAFIAVRNHYPDRLIRYVTADVAQLRGHGSRDAYLELFGGYANGRGYSARANEELTRYLAGHSDSSDRLYIFGMAPSVYFTARRLPADRFVWTYPGVVDFAGRPDFSIEALARDLTAAAPRYLVLERNNRDSASGWRIEDVYASGAVRGFLAQYTTDAVIEDFIVLRRR
jgi:hypothetical protein